MADVTYKDGEVLFQKKDRAENFCFKAGEVELFDRYEKTGAILKPGASFGEQAILDGEFGQFLQSQVEVTCIEISRSVAKIIKFKPWDYSTGFEALLLELYAPTILE